MVLDKSVGFIGAGQMAEALARGFIEKGVITASNVHATDIAKSRRDLFQSFGAHSYDKNAQVIRQDCAALTLALRAQPDLSQSFLGRYSRVTLCICGTADPAAKPKRLQLYPLSLTKTHNLNLELRR